MQGYKKYFLYLTVFITGASVLVIEILGTRVISPFYGATIFVWTSLITITLSALALGYFFGGKFADKHPQSKIFYAIVFFAGLLFLLPMKIDQWVLPFTDQFGLKFGPLFATFIMFFIPLLLFGMITPFAIRLTTDFVERAGSSAGRIFALSTVGSIVGGFLSGFYLIDKLSLSDSFKYMAIILLIVSLVGYYTNTIKKKVKISLTILGALILILLFWQIPPYIYKDNYTLQILEHEQSFYADLKNIKIGSFNCLVINGSTQSCTYRDREEPSSLYLQEMNRIVHRRFERFKVDPENKGNNFKVLFLGLGPGDLVKVLPSEVKLDIIEIDSKVVKMAKEQFQLNLLSTQRIIVDDARHFILNESAEYDIIISDIYSGNSHPVHLLSREAFELFKLRVKPDGLVLMNISGTLLQEDKFTTSIIKTALSVFPSLAITTTYPDEPEQLQAVVLRLSLDDNYEPDISEKYSIVKIDLRKGVLITDDYNPLAVFNLKNLSNFRNIMKDFGGYKMFFSL